MTNTVKLPPLGDSKPSSMKGLALTFVVVVFLLALGGLSLIDLSPKEAQTTQVVDPVTAEQQLWQELEAKRQAQINQLNEIRLQHLIVEADVNILQQEKQQAELRADLFRLQRGEQPQNSADFLLAEK